MSRGYHGPTLLEFAFVQTVITRAPSVGPFRCVALLLTFFVALASLAVQISYSKDRPTFTA